MQKLFRISGLLVALMMVVWIVGCGEEEEAAKPGAVVSTTPAEGGTIAADGTLSVAFDNAVASVAVSPGFAAATSADGGITWTAKGSGLKSGAFTITWKSKDDSSGTKTVNLKVGVADTQAPKVASSSPKDGESGVDPAKVTKIEIEFDEDVASATSKVQAVGGDVLQSKADVAGKKVTINFLGGAKLTNEAKYEVSGKVKDANGNEGDYKITFEMMKKQ